MHRHHPTPVDALFPIGVTIGAPSPGYTVQDGVSFDCTGTVLSPDHITEVRVYYTWPGGWPCSPFPVTPGGDDWAQSLTASIGTNYIGVLATYDDGRTASANVTINVIPAS